MSNYKQEPPFCIQVELTEGCNLMCSFCGINGIRGKAGQYKYLTPELAARIASSVARTGWTSRIEFAMHGEPTLNQDREKIISIFREALPDNQLMMTTNGAGLLRDPVNYTLGLMNNGLNVLAIDDYQHAKFASFIRATFETDGFPYIDYPRDGLEMSPHRRWPKNTKRVIFVEDILKANAGTHKTLTNHCGCGAVKNNSQAGKRCAKPFRELSIRWDGQIAGCCNDWRGVYKIGSVVKEEVEDLWQSPRFTAMRKMLIYGNRTFGACEGCDYRSYRNGLLPDQLGKVCLAPPNSEDHKQLKLAVQGQPISKLINILPWEKAL